eukprot:11178022-Lingulodinium_polyedra.AAC.1
MGRRPGRERESSSLKVPLFMPRTIVAAPPQRQMQQGGQYRDGRHGCSKGAVPVVATARSRTSGRP